MKLSLNTVYYFVRILLLMLLWHQPAWSEDTLEPSTPGLVLKQYMPRLSVDNQASFFFETSPVNPYKLITSDFEKQWTAPDKPYLYFGNSPRPVWIRLELFNETGTPSWLLEIAWTYIEHIKLLAYDHNSATWSPLQEAGNSFLVSDAPTRRYHVLPLYLEPGHHTTVFIRLESSSKLLAPLTIWDNAAYTREETTQSLLHGLFFGAILLMLCYNSSLFFFTRERSYLYYVLYATAVLLYTANITGYAHQFLWASPKFRANIYGVFSSLAFLMGAVFMRRFLELKKYRGWVLRINDLTICHWGALLFLYLFVRTRMLIIAEDAGAVLSGIGVLATTVFLWKIGNRSARYVAIAWSMLIVATLPLMFSMFGISNFTLTGLNLHLTGFMGAIFILSLALTDRLNHERAEREAVQYMTLELTQQLAKAQEGELRAQSRMLAIQHQTTGTLEQRVQERTVELEQTLKSLELANKKLSELSITDALTDIPNRRYFDQILEHEFHRAIRAHQPLSIVLVDIDHFKNINDTYGHQAGDECLRSLARTLKQQCIRGTDLVARYGGEEFAMILPATDQGDAANLADKARQAIEQIRVQWKGQTIAMCASFGVAGQIPYPGETYDSMLQAADKALYHAKSNGRNQVATASLEPRQILPLLPLQPQ